MQRTRNSAQVHRPRLLAAAALVASAALVVSACGGGSGGSAGTAGTEPATGGEPASSALTVWATDDRIAALQDVAARFTADTGTEVVFVEKDWESLRDDFMSQVPLGEGPDVMASGGADWVTQFAENGVAAPVELGDKAEAFTESSLAAFLVDGTVYGVPYGTENVGLVRNVALAPEAPETWDDLLTTGNALVAEGAAAYPILIQQDPTVGDPFHLYGLQSSFGSTVFVQDADGQWDGAQLNLGGEDGDRFAQWLAQMGQEGVLRSTITYDIATEAFANGEAPYMVTGPWAIVGFQDAGLDLAVSEIPSAGGLPSQVFLGVQGYVVSSKSANPISANNFVVNYIGDVETQLELYKAEGRPPALIEALEQEEVASDPISSGFAEAGINGVSAPPFPTMDFIWPAWGAAQLAILNGQGDPVEVWQTMVANLTDKVAQAQ